MDWLIGGKSSEVKRLISHLSDAAKRDRAAQELIRLDNEAVAPLLESLQTADVHLLALVQRILARIPSASPSLIKLLSTAHPIIRGRVAEVFALSKDKTAVPALLEALQGEYFTVRSRAALALGKIGDTNTIPQLLIALKDKEAEVRIAACLALGLFKEPSTFDDLANVLLDDRIIEVRQAAARALGSTRHPKAIPFLMEALRDSYWWYERESAAGDLFQAIEKMGVDAAEPLIEALLDKEGAVRKFAAILLGRIGDARALESLAMAQYDMHHEVGNAAAEALAQFGAPAIPVLTEALSHPESWIRIHAIRALGGIHEEEVVPILVRLLDDPEREIKMHAIKSLKGRRTPAALNALEIIANNRADRELASLAKSTLTEEKQ